MNLLRGTLIGLLAAGALLGCGDALAQARQPPPPWKDPAGPPVDMDLWLKRLVGRFSFEGMVHVQRAGDCDPTGQSNPPCEPIKGMGDCIAVGNGPGVQCILDVHWLDRYDLQDPERRTPWPGAISYLNPAMLLFGLDPGNAAINHLLVNNKGLPEGGLGTNAGNRATFRTSCVNEPGVLGGCERIFRIEARSADARLLYVWIDVRMESESIDPTVSSIVLSLRRVAQDDPGEAPMVWQR